MKKLFTLLVLMTCFLGANAEEIKDFSVDYTQKGTSAITWKAGVIQEEWITADADGLHLYNPEPTENWWDYQLWIFGGATLELDVNYTIKIVAKVSDGSANVRCKIGDWGGGITGNIEVNSTEYQEYTLEGAATVANCGLLVQFGDYVGTVSFKSVTITHEGKAPKPVEWVPVEGLVNGDAESAWPAWALETEGVINANWRGDRTPEICAWALTMGRNFDDQCPKEINGDSYRARPFPADIEVDPTDANNHVFAVHVTEIADIEGGGDGSVAWSNQFWIQAPKAFKNGVDVKVKFRYRADNAASVGTQMHRIYPSNYLSGNGVGTVDFTTEWQTKEQVVTWATDGWSIAFNLTDQNREPNVYYFDDISFEEVKLEEGFFVAASNTTTGIEYDFDTATEAVYDAAEDAYVATVGTVGKQDTWVNEVMISTVRGYDKYFKSATIKPTGKITGNDDSNWQQYTEASSAKISLPAAGVWQISIAPEDKQILFMQLEGEEIVAKEPVDIVTNTTANVVNGQARQDLQDNWDANKGELNVREDADNNPNDEHGAGGEGHTGQTWDNQFFIVANRALVKGEVTVLKFKYKASKEAKTTTQCHTTPGNYKHWAAIGDVNFTTEWQDFEKEFTVPNEADGMQSFAFNMAEIKDACDYEITDVQWYLKDETLAEGKTWENLIDAEGGANFSKKEGAGNAITGIFNITNTITTGSDVIYNLSGQRVSKDYKGIVIKNGKKVIQK